jgi:hypothetical protein
MSDVADTITAPAVEVTPPQSPMIYTGSSNNLVPGAALLFAGLLAFSMGMTTVFFAEATAWTFAIWGALMIYSGLLDINETYEVTDDALIVRNVMRPWAPKKTFDWARVNRLDVVVKRAESSSDDDVTMHVYYQPEGQLAIERRDRIYDPGLAAAVVERASLNPSDRNTPKDVTRIPRKEKATFTWK